MSIIQKIDNNEIYPQMTDEYLKQVAEELNTNCLSKKKQKNIYDDDKAEEWYYEAGSRFNEIDFDFSKCKKYCIKIDMGYCNQYDYVLCNSCEHILEERIRKPFNKTFEELKTEKNVLKTELIETIDVQRKIDLLISYIDKLEERVAMLEAKVNTSEEED